MSKKLEVFLSLLATRQSLLYPLGEPALKLASFFSLKDGETVPAIAVGNYPLVCSKCSKVVGVSYQRAGILRNLEHKSCFNPRKQLLWQNASLWLIARAFKITDGILEHFMVFEELGRLNRYEEKINEQSRYYVAAVTENGFSTISALS